MARKQTVAFQLRVEPEFLDALDTWRARKKPIPSRAAAIREIVNAATDRIAKRAATP